MLWDPCMNVKFGSHHPLGVILHSEVFLWDQISNAILRFSTWHYFPISLSHVSSVRQVNKRQCFLIISFTAASSRNGDKLVKFSDGQREICTVQFRRREYLDGTMKIVLCNSRQETKCSTGQVQIKDEKGYLILDKWFLHAEGCTVHMQLKAFSWQVRPVRKI